MTLTKQDLGLYILNHIRKNDDFTIQQADHILLGNIHTMLLKFESESKAQIIIVADK